MDYGDITIPKICALKKQQDMESDKEKNPESSTIDLKDVSNNYDTMIQYLRGIYGCDGVPLRYVAQNTIDMMLIEEEYYPSNTYANYD